MESIIGFKSSLFGGFNRKDVSQYIERLAAERNALREEAERCNKELNECNAQNNMLALRLGEVQLIAGDAKSRLEELEQQVQESTRRTEEAKKALEAAEQLADEAADTDKALREERDFLAQSLSEADKKTVALEGRIKVLEAQLAEMTARAEEAEKNASHVRINAVVEAIETLDALDEQCSCTADEAGQIADNVNSEFWKVTAAMDDLTKRMRDAAARFGTLSNELKEETL